MLHSWFEPEKEAFGLLSLYPWILTPWAQKQGPLWCHPSCLRLGLRNPCCLGISGSLTFRVFGPGIVLGFRLVGQRDNPGQGLSPKPSAVPDHSEDDLKFEVGIHFPMGPSFPGALAQRQKAENSASPVLPLTCRHSDNRIWHLPLWLCSI